MGENGVPVYVHAHMPWYGRWFGLRLNVNDRGSIDRSDTRARLDRVRWQRTVRLAVDPEPGDWLEFDLDWVGGFSQEIDPGPALVIVPELDGDADAILIRLRKRTFVVIYGEWTVEVEQVRAADL